MQRLGRIAPRGREVASAIRALCRRSSCPRRSAKRGFALDVPGIHALAASKKDVDGRNKPTVVWHGPCLSCRVLRGEVSANIAAPSRGAGCMWSEVKSGLLWLGGGRSFEKFADRAPVHQGGAGAPGASEPAFFPLFGVVRQPQPPR